MPYRDLVSNIDAPLSLAPAARTNGTATGSSIDLRGYDGAMVSFAFGAWTDGTHTPSIQSSTDGTTFNAVTSTSGLQGTLAAVSGTAGQNLTQRAGYVGMDRFIRAMMVTAGATTGALSGATAVRGYPGLDPLP